MWTRNTIACVLTVALLAAAPVHAQGNSGKGGGKGGGGGGDDGSGGGETPTEGCQDRAAAFVYRSEHKNIGEDIMLASSEGCSTTLLSSRPNLTVRNLAYHLNPARSEGIVMWAERDPNRLDYSHDIVALRFSVGNDGAISVGQPQPILVPDSNDSATYLQLPGDVRLGDDGTVYATLLHRSWIVEGETASFELRLLHWTSGQFPSGSAQFSVLTVPGELSLCYVGDCLDSTESDAGLRLEPPVFGSWSDGGAPSLFGDFALTASSGNNFGGVLYWQPGVPEPVVLAYGVSSLSYESAPQIAATSPVLPDSEILLRHHISERGSTDYYGSVVNIDCALGMTGADAWQHCLTDAYGNDGRQIVEARFGAAWPQPDIIVHSQAARKSTDIYRYEFATGSSTRIVTGGWFPVATH